VAAASFVAILVLDSGGISRTRATNNQWPEIPLSNGIKLVLLLRAALTNFMTLNEANQLIMATVDQMNARYGKTVFNEWAILGFQDKGGRILGYAGPRKEDFQKNFTSDLGALRAELADAKYNVGDFEFARHGTGTKFEAFMVLGQGIFLICNHTHATMDDIARDSHWIAAQVPFVELSDRIRANPVAA
jgi:hypothetical protein